MRARSINIPTFEELYNSAPSKIKSYIDRCKTTRQSKQWHPEGDVCKHIKIVYNRARQSGDIDQAMAAFFHDLGKADVTKPHATKPDAWPAHGHENISARLVREFSDWIESYGANSEDVYHIVKQHMRIKQYDNMRTTKQEMFRKDPRFDRYQTFSAFDDMTTLKDDEMSV